MLFLRAGQSVCGCQGLCRFERQVPGERPGLAQATARLWRALLRATAISGSNSLAVPCLELCSLCDSIGGSTTHLIRDHAKINR